MSDRGLFHRFVLADGEVLTVPRHRAQRTLDVRDRRNVIETVWEITLDSGIVRRVWPNELRSWEVQEA